MRVGRAAPRRVSAERRRERGAPDVDDFLIHLAKERDVSPQHASRRTRATSPTFVDVPRRLLRHGANGAGSGIDRLAIRGFLGAPHAARARQALHRARAVGRAAASTSSCTATRAVEANPARGVGSPKLEKYLPGYLDRAQIELAVPDGRVARDGRATSPTSATSRSSSCSTRPGCACRSCAGSTAPTSTSCRSR